MRSEGARSRLARLLDFLDQEEAEPGTATWQESGHHLHKPDSGDQDDNAEESLAHNLRDVEDFFSAGHTYGQNVRRPAAAEREKQQKCKPPGAHREPSITVPQPFKMTLRDAQKKDKSVTMDLLDSLDFKNQEDPECLKQFRAQPVPAHVLLPLYNDLVEEEEERRKSAIQKRKDLLVATQKPFQFLSKEEEKRKQEIERPVTVPTETTQSIRRSIPKSVLDPQISEKLKEAELVRKIQSQMRAKAILEKSAAPIPLSRGIRDPCSSISLKNQQECLGFLQQNLTFQPHIKPAVPDFQRLYRKFQRESMENYQEKQQTRNKPFTLRTSSLRGRKQQNNIQGGEATGLTVKAPNPRGLASLSPNTLPVYVTDSTRKRESAIRTSLWEKEKQENAVTESDRKSRPARAAMQRSISRRAKALDPHRPLSETSAEKCRQIRESDLRRMKEYKEELEEMKARVKARAFLFEHTTKGNAVKEAGRRFTSALQQAGLTEEFVQHHGGTSRQENRQEEKEEAWETD